MMDQTPTQMNTAQEIEKCVYDIQDIQNMTTMSENPLPTLSLHRPHKKQTINKRPYKREPLQAAVDFQPLSQPCSPSVSYLISLLQHTRECSRPPPAFSLHRPHKKQTINKKPYKMELLQAAVDFQPLSQPFSPSVSYLIPLLQHKRECSRPPPHSLPASPPQKTNNKQKALQD